MIKKSIQKVRIARSVRAFFMQQKDEISIQNKMKSYQILTNMADNIKIMIYKLFNITLTDKIIYHIL